MCTFVHLIESNKMIHTGWIQSFDRELKKNGKGEGGGTQTQLPIIKVHKMNLLFRNIITSIVCDQYYSITAEIHLVFLLMSLDILWLSL